jgi:hypothetical protein
MRGKEGRKGGGCGRQGQGEVLSSLCSTVGAMARQLQLLGAAIALFAGFSSVAPLAGQWLGASPAGTPILAKCSEISALLVRGYLVRGITFVLLLDFPNICTITVSSWSLGFMVVSWFMEYGELYIPLFAFWELSAQNFLPSANNLSW